MSARIRWTCLTLASLFWAGLFAADASAQFGMSGNTSTGSFGSRTLGGSTSSNRTGRSTGASNSGSLTGLSGQGGQGGQGMAGGALGTGAPTGERYVRGNRNGAFVGADTGDGAANSYSGMAGGMNGMNGMGGAGGLGGMMGNQMMMQAFRQNQQRTQGQNQNQQNKLQVRIPFRVDSISAPPLTTAFTSRMTTRYANLPALAGKGNIAMVMEGDTLVLQGQVQSAADRQLAEDLLSLEPGVTLVRNELEIAQPELPIPVSTSSAGNPASNLETAAYVPPSAPRRVSQPLER
jgi:osmotically-inducible protein OsmY